MINGSNNGARVAPIQSVQQQQLASLQRSAQQVRTQPLTLPISSQQIMNDNVPDKTKFMNNDTLRKCLKPLPTQSCLSILPCTILIIPFIVFISQLITFFFTDLLLMKNEMVVNDIYFENLCDPSNMIMKLNISQRWNATFDFYISQMEMIVVDDENGDHVFKCEMLPIDETTSPDFVPPSSKRTLSAFGNSYIAYIPKGYEKVSGKKMDNPDVLDIATLKNGIVAFKFTSNNLEKLTSLLGNVKEDKRKSQQDTNIVSIKINAKMGVSPFQDLQFRIQFQSPNIQFPLPTSQSLKSKCEKCRSSKETFEKKNTEEYRARAKVIKEKGLKSRKSNFIINSIENLVSSSTKFLVGINGMQDNIYISGDSDFNNTLRISTGLNAQPIMDFEFSFFSKLNNKSDELSKMRKKTLPPKVIHDSKTMKTHGSAGLKWHLNKKTHEKGARETINSIFQGTLHDELRKLLPVKISAVKDNTPREKQCFLKAIMDSIDFNFALDTFNGKNVLNKSITEIMAYNRDEENLCRIDPEDTAHCSISETKNGDEKNEGSDNATRYRPAALDYLVCVPKAIKMPASKSSTAVGVISIEWTSSSFKECLSLVNEYEVMGIENTRAPILWIEEIISGFYVQFMLDYKVDDVAIMDINVKFGSKVVVNGGTDDYADSRVITSALNGVPERYNWKFSGSEENFILERFLSQILGDLRIQSATDSERSTAFCRLLPAGGTFQNLLGIGSSLKIPYEFTLELPSIITGALPDVDFGNVPIQIFDPQANVEIGTLTIIGEWFYSFSTTRGKITYMFTLAKSYLNLENSTVISRFWGRVLSSTSVPVTFTVKHRNVHLKSQNINLPKGLISQDCENENIPKMEGKTFFSNFKLVHANFGNTTSTTCYGTYDIQMNINNVLSFPLQFAYPESHLGCIYLYRDVNGIEKKDIVSIGCGSYIQTNQIEKYQSVKDVKFHIDNSKASEKKYLDLKRDITKNNMIKTTWGIDESNIVDGTNENECIKLRSDGINVLQRKWKIAIVAKLAVKFDSTYTMQLDNIIYPPQEFVQPKYVENTTFRLQYEDSNATEENKQYKKIELIDLDRWNEMDKIYGDLDFSSNSVYSPSGNPFNQGLYIDGAGFFFIIFFAILGCCSTCYSILAIISKCKMCPCYKKYIEGDQPYGSLPMQGINGQAFQVVPQQTVIANGVSAGCNNSIDATVLKNSQQINGIVSNTKDT